MLWIQFLLQNAHFAIHLLAALAFFAVFWLYFDAWVDRKNLKEIPRILGWFLLAISFVISAGTVESRIVTDPVFSVELSRLLVVGLRMLGYGMVLVGLIIEPLQEHIKIKGVDKDFFGAGLVGLIAIDPVMSQIRFLLPVLVAVVALMYLRRGTIGLEFHIRAVAKSLFVFSLVELLALAGEFRNTSNVDVYSLVTSFSWLWIGEHVVLLIATIMMLVWVWQYLLKRLETQLFMIYTASILMTFLAITVAFTGLLVKNVQDEVLSRLQTDVRVLDYALASKLGVVRADAETLADNLHIQEAIVEEDLKTLRNDVEQYLLNKSESMMIVTNVDGQVLARGEDREKIGDSLSDNSLVRKALSGEGVTSVVVGSGVLAPRVWVRAAVPVKAGETILGVVMTGMILDNAFVDGVKEATNLEASIYADEVLSATTLKASDGVSRFTGTSESNEVVVESVLSNGEEYVGGVRLFDSEYFGAYKPLLSDDGATVGMLFVGTPQTSVFKTAGKSIELTFLIAAGLIVLSVIPSKIVSKYIASQLR